MDKRKRIMFDIDGTITKKGIFVDFINTTPKEFSKQMDKAKPDKEMIAIVNKYYDEGYVVALYTARSDLYEQATKHWLDKHGVKYHFFTMNKPFYDIFVDDKCIRPEELKLWNKI